MTTAGTPKSLGAWRRMRRAVGDLIVLKAFADRPKDWMDIEGVIIRQGATLDWPYVRTQLAPLAELKEAPGLLETLEQARTRFGYP
jgi:hypothetical protein